MHQALPAPPATREAATASRQAASSVDNALLLMAALQEMGSLRVSEAAQLLGVAVSTAHRLLNQLKDHGYADQDHQRVYRGVFRRAGDPGHRLVAQAARPRLDALAGATGATVHLGVLEGNGVRFVASAQGPGSAPAGPRVGWLLPAHVSSTGKVLLAELPAAKLGELYPFGVPATHRERACTVAELRRRLEAVRRRGWAVDREESEAGIVAVAVAVRARSGIVVGALSLSARSGSVELPEPLTALPALQAAAHRIGRGPWPGRSAACVSP